MPDRADEPTEIPAASPEPAADGTDGAVAEAEAAKPARKPRASRAKAKAEPAPDASAEPEASAEAEPAAEDAPAPKPRRSRAKKTEAVADEAPAAVADEPAEEVAVTAAPEATEAPVAEPLAAATPEAADEPDAADAAPESAPELAEATAEGGDADVFETDAVAAAEGVEPQAEDGATDDATGAAAVAAGEAQPEATAGEDAAAAAAPPSPDEGPAVDLAAQGERPQPSAETRESRPAQPEPREAAPAPVEEVGPAFEDLGLGGPLLKALKDVGYEEPTPIQVRTIPVLLEGRDVIAQAQTGSGKTAAFGLPIIEAIDPRVRAPQALILCPTRELAIQVSEALHKYGKHKEVETLPIYGGQPYERQFRGLQRGVQIVVGTPGRVMDHMRRGTLILDDLRFFVLDEADEMLDMGFIDDIEWILEQAPEERQTALFSATMPPRIVELAQQHMHQPERISVAGREMTVKEIEQVSYEIPRARKVDALTRILDAETPTSAMIFCRTKNGVDELGEALMARGYAAETLHGDLSQVQRDRVMRRFRAGQADVLIATDVAARGLDIPDVSHVFNYDIPDSAEAYVHRIGRTGRAGKAGTAITLITPKETRWLRQIERTTRAKIQSRRLPTLADVAERRREVMKEQVLAVLEAEDGYAQYIDTIHALADDRDVSEVAAAILKLYADETGRAVTPEQQEDDLATFTAATGAGRGPRGEAGMVRLVLNLGRFQGVRPQDIVGAIANEADIPGRAIGAIDILDHYTFVDIPQEFVGRVLEAMRHKKLKGRPVTMDLASNATPPPPGPRDGFDRDRNRGPRPGGFDRGPRPGGFDRAPRQGGYDRDRQQGGYDRQPRGQFDDRQPRGGFDRDRDRDRDRGPRDGGFPGDDRAPRDAGYQRQGGFDRDRPAPRDGGYDRDRQQGGYDRDRQEGGSRAPRDDRDRQQGGYDRPPRQDTFRDRDRDRVPRQGGDQRTPFRPQRSNTPTGGRFQRTDSGSVRKRNDDRDRDR